MFFKTFITAIFLVVSFFSSAQVRTFQKLYAGSFSSFAQSIAPVNDGGYIMGGSYEDRFFLAKIDQNGDTVWLKKYVTTDLSQITSIKETADGGFIATGYIYSATTLYDILSIKTDAGGNLLWTKTYGGAGFDFPHSIELTNDGGYIIAGYTESFGPSDKNMYIIKTNSTGDTSWTKIIGTDSADVAYTAFQCQDGGFMIGGQTWGIGAGEGDFYIIKTDSDGNALWSKLYGGRWDENLLAMKQTTDGGYIMAGWTESWLGGVTTDTTTHPPFNIFDVYIVRTNGNGDTVWTRTFGGAAYDIGNSVYQTADENFIVGGQTSSFGGGYRDLYVIKINSSGDSLWTKTIGTSSNDLTSPLIETPDGGYTAAGASYNFTTGLYELYVIKADAFGKSGCNEYDIKTLMGNTYTSISDPNLPNTTSNANITANSITTETPAMSEIELCYCSISAALSGTDSICLGDTVTLSATGGNRFLWNTGDTTQNISVSPVDTTRYWVKISNDSCSDSASIVVHVNPCTFIKETDKENIFVSVFPNPFTTVTTIEIKTKINEQIQLKFYDLLGKEVTNNIDIEEKQTSQEIQYVITNKSLNRGVYFFQITDQKKIRVNGKIVIN